MKVDSCAAKPDFGFSIVNGRDIPPPTAEDLQPEESGKLWKEERAEFNRLKRLARAIGIEKVIVSPESALPDLKGWYVYSGWGVDSLSAQGWDLSEEQIRSINRKKGPVILIDYHSCYEQGASHTLAHEIGHHVFRLARFTQEEQNTPVTETMKGFFPNDEYVHRDRDEICAECFAEYFTKVPLRKAVEQHCESVLRRVCRHDPAVVKLVREYR